MGRGQPAYRDQCWGFRSGFIYDGLSPGVRIVEKNGASVTRDKRLLWVGNAIDKEMTDNTGAKGCLLFGVELFIDFYFENDESE